MEGKYLITTDAWFYAPDGLKYRGVWGEVKQQKILFLRVENKQKQVQIGMLMLVVKKKECWQLDVKYTMLLNANPTKHGYSNRLPLWRRKRTIL